MPTQSRKRRSQPENSDDHDASPPQRRKLTQNTQSRTQRQGGVPVQNGRRTQRTATPDEEEEEEEVEEDVGSGVDGDEDNGEANKDRLVKKLVRLALATEYTRQPLRRTDISAKVLGSRGKMFKVVFDQTQNELRRVFGMELVELPMREKTKLNQRRAAQNTEKGPASSNQYILVTVLPEAYREPEILCPHGFKEQTYTGFVTMVVSLIYLNGRVLAENKLNRYLSRMNADEYMPIEKTDKVIATMVKQGYIVKQKDDLGEGGCDYYLGPRAKVEIGSSGVLSILKTVYGVTAPEDLEKKLKRNIGLEFEAETAAAKKPRGGKRRTQDNED